MKHLSPYDHAIPKEKDTDSNSELLIKGINNQFERSSSELTSTAVPRPTGVIVAAILNIIGGIIMLIIGPPLAFAGTIIPFVLQSTPEQQQQNMTSGDVDFSQIPPSLLGAGILALCWILLAIGYLSWFQSLCYLVRETEVILKIL